MDTKQLNKKLRRVPPQLIPEIMDYIDFLINKYGINDSNKKTFSFNWGGGLSEISNKYSSVELQHKSMDWR